jgi:hypothetical protein
LLWQNVIFTEKTVKTEKKVKEKTQQQQFHSIVREFIQNNSLNFDFFVKFAQLCVPASKKKLIF